MDKKTRKFFVNSAMEDMLIRHEHVPYDAHKYEEIGGLLWGMYHAPSKQIKERVSRVRAEWHELTYQTGAGRVTVFYDKRDLSYAGFSWHIFTPLPAPPAPPAHSQLLLPF